MNIKFLSFLTLLAVSSGSTAWLYASKQIQDGDKDKTSLPHQNDTVEQSRKIKPRNIIQSATPSHKADDSYDKLNESDSVNLIDNWDLSEITSNSADLAQFFQNSQPKKIVYYGINGIKHIYPKQYAAGNAQSDSVLFLSSAGWIAQTVQERQPLSIGDSIDNTNKNPSQKENFDNLIHLPDSAYDILSYSAGTRSDKKTTLVPSPTNLRAALNGPDYYFDDIQISDPAYNQKMTQLLSTVLPLGNSGSLVLKIRNNGVILNNGGVDFSVYQTTFRIEGTDLFWHKFAHLGVSNTLDPSTVNWFPCDPEINPVGCVGVVPTDEGGDQFNISAIGLTQARYIWIQDTGFNKNLKSKWPTEGCALDALRIYNGYITK